MQHRDKEIENTKGRLKVMKNEDAEQNQQSPQKVNSWKDNI